MKKNTTALCFAVALFGILSGYFFQQHFAEAVSNGDGLLWFASKSNRIASQTVRGASKTVEHRERRVSQATVIFGVLRSLSSEKRNAHEIHKLLEYLASVDHESALAAAAELETKGFPKATAFVAMGWAEADPKAACRWASLQPNATEDLNFALTGMLKIGAYGAAADIASKLSGMAKSIFVDRLARDWGKVSEEDTLHWLSTLPQQDAQMRDRGIAALMGTMANTDSQTVGDLAWKTLPPGPSRASALGAVVKTWLQQGGTLDQVSHWLAGLPSPEDQGPAIAQLAIRYSGTDLQKAVDLVGSIPSDAERNQAIILLGSKMPSNNPKLQFSLSEKTSGNQRLSALKANVANWAHADPGAAFSYIQSDPNLDPVEKQTLQQIITAYQK